MKNTILLLFTALVLSSCSDNGKIIKVEESGTIETTDVVLSSQTAGKIIKLNFDEGANVKLGGYPSCNRPRVI